METKLQNPTLYVFIGAMQNALDEIMREAETTHSDGGAVRLHLDETDDMDRYIRASKAKLQSLDTGLNIQRVNIYVLAKAHDSHATKLVSAAGQKLHTLFAEDFAAHHLTLVVFFSESNESDEDGYSYETRSKATYDFLTSTTGYTAYDRIFLLSDRNEYGRVSHTNRKNTYGLVAYLPFLHSLGSRFDETLAVKTNEAGRVLFASAGFGKCDNKCPEDTLEAETNHYLHLIAQALENELLEGEKKGNSAELPKLSYSDEQDFCLEKEACAARFLPDSMKIISDIASVAANPLSIFNLLGVTIVEAESLLFGDRASRFFEENYMLRKAPEKPPIRLPFNKLVEKVGRLKHVLERLSCEISALSQSLVQYECRTVRLIDTSRRYAKMLDVFHMVDGVKDAIGQCYATKYKLENMQAIYSELIAEHAELEAYVEYMRELITSLKALPVPTPTEIPADQLLSQAEKQAALNISLLRTDGLIHERHQFGEPENPCVLRLIGGFTLEDLTRYNAMRSLSIRT